MKRINCTTALSLIILAVFVGLSTEARGTPQSESAPQDGTAVLTVKVILVGADLALKPVPKRQFTIRSIEQPESETRLTTSFDGEAEVLLPQGDYRIVSKDPVEFEGTSFTWDVPVTLAPGEHRLVELSNDNASAVTVDSAPPERVVLDEGSLYRVIKDGVLKVISESGHGSGFLVDSRGLLLTNHHVASGSEYLAVKLNDKEQYEAILVAEDAFNDIAVLRINPHVIQHLPILELAEDEPDHPPVSVGERVLAIGSPLATETILTTGIVSKVEQNAIYSDVSINPGNSGGPLFSSRGRVIGITTFGLGGPSGPGVSGIVRIHLAAELLSTLTDEKVGANLPSDRALPVESSFRFPANRLREKALAMEYEPKKYHVEAGQIDVQVITPVVVARLEVEDEVAAAERQKKRSKKSKPVEYVPGTSFYNWRQYAGDYRAVVTIHAIPEIQLTTGSAWAVAFFGNLADRNYRFKCDFLRMELRRGGVLIEPIHPGRIKEVISVQAKQENFQDVGVWGKYTYPPEAFRPGAPVTLSVWNSDLVEPNVKTVSPELQDRIWADFKEYFESLEDRVSG